MRITIVRVIMGIASVCLIGLWPLPALLAHLVLLIWVVPRFVAERQLARTCRFDAREAIAAATFLTTELNVAQQQIASLKRQLERAGACDQVNDLLFRKVGLATDCPAFAARAVRKAYRRTFHPDLQPTARKAEAERRFKLAESVFDEIWALRGFPP